MQKMPFWKIERAFAYMLVVAAFMLGIPEILPDSMRYLSPTAIVETRPDNLPDHCDATGNTYQLQFVQQEVNPNRYHYDERWSPDGRYLLIALEEGVYILAPGTDEAPVWLSEYQPDVLYQYHWAPGSNRLAYVLVSDVEPGLGTIIVFDVAQGLDAITEVTLSIPMHSFHGFLGWSNTGAYLVTRTGNGHVAIWSVEQQRMVYDAFREEPDLLRGRLGYAWSPDDSHLAYVWHNWENDRYNWFISLVSIHDSTVIDFSLNDLGTMHPRGIESLRWSPDSTAVALFFQDRSAYGSLFVAQVDGGHARLIVYGPPASQMAFWSTDGQSLLFWKHLTEDAYHMAAWNPSESTYRIVMQSIQMPSLAQKGEPLVVITARSRMAVVNENPDGTTSIAVMNADGSNLTPFLENVISAGSPNWSPTGETVAAAWAVEEDDRREVRVSWMDHSGAVSHELDDDFIDARDFHWSPDGRVLIFVGVHEDGFSLEWLAVETGIHRVLLDELVRVEKLAHDAETGEYFLRWRTENNGQGYAAFDRDGNPLYNVAIRDPEYSHTPYFSELFWAPDGQHVALRWRNSSGEVLLLTSADGSDPHLVRSGLHELGDPLWSPDGSMTAFTQSQGQGQVELHIADTDGHDHWSISFEDLFAGRLIGGYELEWVRCE